MILGGHFDVSAKDKRITELEDILNQPNIWNDNVYASKVNSELINLKKELSDLKKASSIVSGLKDLMELVSLDDSLKDDLEAEFLTAEKLVEELEVATLLNGPYDNLNCFLEIHPGAGGTEAMDWASMLLRMYERFCEANGYKYEVIDFLKGEEAGVKSVTLRISGNMSYGYFKGEKGVHRLVRISPFDSNKRRHTSFASVTVVPEFDKVSDIEIKDEDLKIDVFHSSGAGGQSVNTSDSAVRITHLPTKIVVSCQVERSQLRNKERAMEMLKSKLYQLEVEKKEAELNKEKGISDSINFGSQIRNYVLEPYTLVKDLRSGYEKQDTIEDILGIIIPETRDMFACEMIATKAVSIAQERIQALEHMGFCLSEEALIGHDETKYNSYYVREV